jgi:hypothetical protein
MGCTKMKTVMQCMLFTILCLMICSVMAAEVADDNKAELVVALGAANVFDDSRYAGVGLEYRFLPVWRKLRPVVGYSTTRKHDQYVYIGIRYFIDINDVWRFNPTFALGLFDSGNGLKLGGSVEFRSGFEFSRQITDRLRLGLGFSHLSNSRLYKSNPGTETIELSLAVNF